MEYREDVVNRRQGFNVRWRKGALETPAGNVRRPAIAIESEIQTTRIVASDRIITHQDYEHHPGRCRKFLLTADPRQPQIGVMGASEINDSRTQQCDEALESAVLAHSRLLHNTIQVTPTRPRARPK